MRKFYLLMTAVLFFYTGESQVISSREAQYKDSPEPAQLNFFLASAKSNFFSNRPAANAFATKAYAVAVTKTAYLPQLADAYNLLGLISMYDEKYGEAEGFLQKSLHLSIENNFTSVKLKALLNLALNYSREGDYQKSLQANFTLLPLLQAANDKLTTANCLANISNAYSYLNRPDETIRYQLEALKLFQELNYANGIGNAYNTLGNAYTEQKNYNKAIEYLQKSITLKKTTNDEESLANSYVNLATLYFELKNYSQDLDYLRQAEGLYKKLKNKKGLVKTYANMGAHYAKVEDYATAREMEEKAIDLSKSDKDEYVNADLYRNASLSYAKLNDLTKAYDYSRKALNSKDSLMNFAVQKQITDMQVRYETEKKERALREQELLLKGQELQLAQNRLAIVKRNYIIAGSAGLLLLLCSLFYLGYRRYQWKQEARMQATILKQQEAATKAVLEAEEAERQRIAKDLHDGVGQMMSAAKMNLSAYEHAVPFATTEQKQRFEKIVQLVDESCHEVRAVSHNMMPNALLKNSLASAIREFIGKLDSRQLAVHLYTEGLEERLDMNVETVLYRVIQECVNNVVKHSGANKMDISVLKDMEEITATIEDNGGGFDVSNVQEAEGMGLKNIRTRIAYLKGTVDFDSAKGRGTLVALHVPL